MESDAKRDAAAIVRKIEDEAKLTADRKAREIIAYSIQRYAGDVVAEHTVSVVNLPSEEMKGRIIGREGRNIRAIEAATGIDLIIDDTPEAVVLSSFDPIRREVARISLERLIQDGRIHPGRIEEIVKKVERKSIRSSGKPEKRRLLMLAFMISIPRSSICWARLNTAPVIRRMFCSTPLMLLI